MEDQDRQKQDQVKLKKGLQKVQKNIRTRPEQEQNDTRTKKKLKTRA